MRVLLFADVLQSLNGVRPYHITVHFIYSICPFVVNLCAYSRFKQLKVAYNLAAVSTCSGH